MNPTPDELRHALLQARLALQSGDRNAARRWARQAVAIAPEKEQPWLLLAALASPRARVAYLQRALEINPHSQRAHHALHQAIQHLRIRQQTQSRPQAHPQLHPPPTQPVYIPQGGKPASLHPSSAMQPAKRRAHRRPWVILPLATLSLLLVVITLAAWTIFPAGWAAGSQTDLDMSIPTAVQVEMFTPLPTTTYISTPSPTDTATLPPTDTETPTTSPTATLEPTTTPSPTDLPTASPSPEPLPTQVLPPSGVEMDERWIDVDLTNQQLSAYQGAQLLQSFLVSTGTAYTPTVTGLFKIYVKHPAADMVGPGYNLPDVPYVMMFYEDYGIHGTYWHSNFGTPMSHGCVNMRTEDAAWLYDWAKVGTVVNIHY